MRKLALITLIGVGLLSGCSGDKQVIKDSNGNQEDISTYIYTDKDTGCKYIIFNWYQGGGASPKLDEKGHPAGCGDNVKKFELK